MKALLIGMIGVIITGCVTLGRRESSPSILVKCIGTTEAPASIADKVIPIQDRPLLALSLGEPGKGALCQGQTYVVKAGEEITLYRVWNSTNPGSRLGSWWASAIPRGQVKRYRQDYEICYQWSPLDSMTHCTFKAGTRLVIGTGQSAECSEYLTYPVSSAKQVFVPNADKQSKDCVDYVGKFDWQTTELD